MLATLGISYKYFSLVFVDVVQHDTLLRAGVRAVDYKWHSFFIEIAQWCQDAIRVARSLDILD